MIINTPSSAFNWPTISVDLDRLRHFLAGCEDAGMGYGLGAKFPSLGADPRGVRVVDCSGFVRAAIYQASDPAQPVVFVDGSVSQHEQCERVGFKRSENSDGLLNDGVLRIGFLTPEDGGGVGHVVLILDGNTLESYGHHGPGSRVWGSCGFMGKMAVFVLAVPN